MTQIIILVSSLMLPGLSGAIDPDPAADKLVQVLQNCGADWDANLATPNPDEHGTSFLRIIVKAGSPEECVDLLKNADGVQAAYIKPEEALP